GLLNNLGTLEVYDPATDTWTTKANMPTGRTDLAAAAIDGKLYAVGGSGGNLNELEVYETPEPNAWTGKTGMPTARHGLAAAAIDGQLYAVGGGNNSSVLNKMEDDDEAADNSARTTARMTARSWIVAA